MFKTRSTAPVGIRRPSVATPTPAPAPLQTRVVLDTAKEEVIIIIAIDS